MSDSPSLDFLGGLMRSVQAEQRTIRAEVEATRHELRTRMDVMERCLGERISAIEARIEMRFDYMRSKIVRSLDEIMRALRREPPDGSDA